MSRSICHITTMPIPRVEHTDAHIQEIQLLMDRFGGGCYSVYPYSQVRSYVPSWLYGLRQIKRLRRSARTASIIQIWSTNYVKYPFIKLLPKKKIVYTVMTSVPQDTPFDLGLKAVVVQDPTIVERRVHDTHQLYTSPPMSLIRRTKLPYVDSDRFNLLMASAPWTTAQFESKGIHLLLRMVERLPWLQVTLLWRGAHSHHMRRLINHHPHSERIEMIDEVVDVEVLQRRMQATVLLSSSPRVVKAYPHSLIESLQCGRPVLLSAQIPMAHLIDDHGCGVVVSDLSDDVVAEAITRLRDDYEAYARRTIDLPDALFSSENFLAFYDELYLS